MMMNDPTDGVVTKVSEWMINMALLNLFWLLLTLLGGIVFGWAPATVAIMTVWRQQARNTEKIITFKGVWQAYRENFLQANAIGWLIKLSGIALVFYSFTLVQWSGLLMIVFATIFLIIAFTFTMVTVFIFPVYIHYQLNFLDYFRYALIIGWTQLHFTAIILVSIGVIFWGYTIFPGLLLAFAASLPLGCLTHLSLNVFEKIEDKHLHYSNQR